MAKRTIVVGADGSSGGRHALAWALRHAADTGAMVDVVTAYTLDGTDWFDPDGPSEQREIAETRQHKDVETALREIAHPPQVRHHVIEADPVQALLRASAQADLLVLGSHGRGGLGTVLFGTTSERCIRHGSVPVLIVPGNAASAGRR